MPDSLPAIPGAPSAAKAADSASSLPPLLQVDGLCVTYRTLGGSVRAVVNFTLRMARGEAVGIVGESGSGKSTVALALMGLLDTRHAEVSGHASLGGDVLLPAGPAALCRIRGRRIGMIFQDPMTSLNPYLNIGYQVMETPRIHGRSRQDARKIAVDLLESMQMADPPRAFARYPHQYSGGMRQRAMAASAFSGSPELLIADEPTTALDVITQDRVLRLMKQHLRERNMSLLLITHDLGIVAGICDRVVVMKDGEIVETAPVEQLYSAPRHSYTQCLLRAVPRVDAASPGGASAGKEAAGLPAAGTDRIPRPVVRVDRLVVEFGRGREKVTAVDAVSLDLLHGEILGLVGQSGSGKSTLARAIAGLNRPRSGEIEVNGLAVDSGDRRKLKVLRRNVQMVFQDPRASLNSRLTIERIVTEPLINFGLAGRRAALDRAHELLATVHLPAAWGNRYPYELSGGQCQRVGIARALAVSPGILLCDEPVSALDVSIQAEILHLLAELRGRLNLTILFISHDLAVVRNIADRVAVMHRGRIVEIKRAHELYAAAEHDYTRLLLRAIPIPDPKAYRIAGA